MKCPNCNEEIEKCTICPYCKYNLTKADTIQTKEKDRTLFIFIFKIILIAILSISALACIVSNEISSGIVCIILAVMIYIILTIFESIIDLLQQINNKL